MARHPGATILRAIHRLLKPLMPAHLFGRFLLILVLPMVLAQGIAIYVFYERHWDSVSRHMVKGLAGDILFITTLLNDAPATELPAILEKAGHTLYLHATFTPHSKLQMPPSSHSSATQRLREYLLPMLQHEFNIRYIDDGDAVQVDIAMDHGVLSIISTSKRIENRTTTIFILWMVSSGIILILIALLFTRNQLRAISRLAIAAEKFGRGLEGSYFKPQGAEEVKKAARAFIRMKRRIKRQVTTRTSMLSNISHDLKTPLTRMKLQLAMMQQTEDIQALQSDVMDMEHMVQEYLDFARGEGTETPSAVNIQNLLFGLKEKYRHHPLAITLDTDRVLLLRLHAMRRAFGNLIDNALRYGTEVVLHAEEHRGYVVITVDDNGPGIPKDKRQVVFQPFVRLDPARTQSNGGSVGLGLTITRDIIQSHGGQIHLQDNPRGGLRVEVLLPI